MLRHAPAPSRWDLLLAAAMAAAGELEVVLAHVSGPRWASVGAAALGPAALVWRRVFPLPAMAAAVTVECAQYWAGVVRNDATTPLIVFVVAMYALGSRAALREVVLGGALALVLAWLVVVFTGPFDATDFPWTGLIMIAPLILGRALRSTKDEASASVARAEREHALATEQALAAERARIARELHDVVSHSISVMGVQAGAVRRLLPDDRGELHEVLCSIEETGREALGEMRRLLGIVRDGSGPLSLTPQPRLAGVTELIEQARAAGLHVEFETLGVSRALPAGLDLAAYRIVQEALTNVRKHAPGARARVTVQWTPRGVELSVCDNGPGAATLTTGGHGIVGMRERAVLYGGALDVGPARGGGFQVRARLPLPEEAR